MTDSYDVIAISADLRGLHARIGKSPAFAADQCPGLALDRILPQRPG